MTLRPPAAEPSGPAEPVVQIVRSRRRQRTVSAYRDGDRTVVLVPAGLPRADEARWVADMLARLSRREARRDARTRVGDDELTVRAAALSDRHLDGRAVPASVRWVTNQNSRWGSCTPAEGTIRLSHRLRTMPPWVLDYVLVHELAHLLVPGHGPRFWRLVERYPRTERARGFLEGVALAAGLDLSPGLDDETDDAEDTVEGEVVRSAGEGPAA